MVKSSPKIKLLIVLLTPVYKSSTLEYRWQKCRIRISFQKMPKIAFNPVGYMWNILARLIQNDCPRTLNELWQHFDLLRGSKYVHKSQQSCRQYVAGRIQAY
jgi:hypothetical protein